MVQTKKEAELAKKKAAAAAVAGSSKAGTPLERAQEVLAAARPLARTAHQQYQLHAPKVLAIWAEHGDKLPMLIAVPMLLFGVHFALCILAYRAVQLLCRRPLAAAYAALDESYAAAWAKVKQDGAVVGGTGAHVTECVGAIVGAVVEDPAAQKTDLQVMLKCVDPDKAVAALGCLWAGLAAVLATLWSAPLRAVLVGAHLTTQLQAEQFVAKALAKAVPALEADIPQGPWVQFGFRAVAFVAAFLFAYLLTGVSLAVSCALDGSRVVTEVLVAVAQQKGWMDEQKAKEQAFLVVYGVAALGLFSQLLVFDAVPWYLSIFFLPGLVAESVLGWFA